MREISSEHNTTTFLPVPIIQGCECAGIERQILNQVVNWIRPFRSGLMAEEMLNRTRATAKFNQRKGKRMKTVAGLWIDHREAVIVLLSDKGQETKRIKSHVEKQLRRSGRSPSNASFEAQMVPADDSRQREYTGNLADYYDEVISCLRPAEEILLFGPGEAKGELKKRIKGNKLDLRVQSIETTDKMTERQISQKVLKHYSPLDATRATDEG
jgi:hypothetical protein